MANNVTLVAASQVLNFPADPAATDTVTIGNITYTFIASPGTAYDVDVGGAGANKAGSLANLVAAINASGAAGATTYFAGTLQNPYVSAVVTSATEITVTARIPGTIGNGITTTTSETDIAWEGATLAGGTGHLHEFLDSLIDHNQLNAEVIREIEKLRANDD